MSVTVDRQQAPSPREVLGLPNAALDTLATRVAAPARRHPRYPELRA
jgi:hypothetical protein